MKHTKLLTVYLILILSVMCFMLSACGSDLAASASGVGNATSSQQTADSIDDNDMNSDIDLDDESEDIYEYDSEYDDMADDEESTAEDAADSGEPVLSYVLNTNTHKFHYPDCRSVKQMKDKNKLEVEATRDEVIAKGYDPCGNCNP